MIWPCVACLLGQALRCDNPQLAELGSPAGKGEATTMSHSHDSVSLLDISSHDRYFLLRGLQPPECH